MCSFVLFRASAIAAVKTASSRSFGMTRSFLNRSSRSRSVPSPGGTSESILPSASLKRAFVGARRDGVVERLRFFIEGELRAFEHAHARRERFELLDQKRAPEPERLLFPARVRASPAPR